MPKTTKKKEEKKKRFDAVNAARLAALVAEAVEVDPVVVSIVEASSGK